MIYIVDDDEALRNSLAFVMENADLPAQLFGSAAEFLAAYDRAAGGCLILDLSMPQMTGLELLDLLRKQGMHLPIIVVTGHADVSAAVRAMKLGVVEFLEKPVDPHTLVTKVHEALRADAAQEKHRADVLASQQRLVTLSNREREMLRLLVYGKSNKEIADELGISPKTAANHRAHLLAKSQAANTADLVRISVLAGIC